MVGLFVRRTGNVGLGNHEDELVVNLEGGTVKAHAMDTGDGVFRKCAKATLLVLSLLSLVLTTACAHGPTRLAGKFRSSVARGLDEAARKAGVTIDTDQLAVSTKKGFVLLGAPIEGLSVPDEITPDTTRKLMVVYTSFPSGSACARAIPDGYYLIAEHIAPQTGELRAQFLNDYGEVVIDFPIEREIMDSEVDDKGEMATGIVDLTITEEEPGQAAATIYSHVWSFPNHHDWAKIVITSGPDK